MLLAQRSSGAGSIQAEVYFLSKYKPLTKPDDMIEPVVIETCTACGLIREDDKVVFTNARLLQYANIIFDLDRRLP